MKIRKDKTYTDQSHRKMTVNVTESDAFKDAQKRIDKALKICAKRR